MAKLGFLSLTMSKHLKGLAGYVSLTSAGRRFVGILGTGPTEYANDESSFETAKSKNACPKHPHGHMYVQFNNTANSITPHRHDLSLFMPVAY